MDVFRNIFLTSLLFAVTSAYGQVELSKEATKQEQKKKEKEEKVKVEKDHLTEVFLHGNWSYTTRKLVSNDGFFGDSLGERANETGMGNWSLGLGIRNSVTKHLTWEGGISMFLNGEKYSFSDNLTDSTYSYTTRYMYIAMPLKLYYTYGESIQLMAGAGIVPQMFIRTRQLIHYASENGTETDEDVKTKIGYNPFVVSAVFNLGVKFRVGESWSVFILPEYKLQLTSSYSRNDSYKHFGRSIGVNAGISIDL